MSHRDDHIERRHNSSSPSVAPAELSYAAAAATMEGNENVLSTLPGVLHQHKHTFNLEAINCTEEKKEKTPFLLRPIRWIKKMKETLREDIPSICLLLFLYLLQGVPLGLIGAVPLILQSKEITYAQQAVFSFAHWPFSMKLLWAPIVDSVYFRKMGRRKSWMVPCQYLIGLFLLGVSYFAPEVLGTKGNNGPNVALLMGIFLPLNFLAATQDIAVDGWALTMLSRRNVGYASTCNVVGQTLGYFLGNVVFLTLQSKNFANKWFRSEPAETGLVDFDGFAFFWGWVFVVTTTLVLIFKHEVDHSAADNSQQKQTKAPIEDDDEEMKMGVWDTYAILMRIMRLKSMRLMVFMLLTCKIAFAAADSMTDLKLIAAGITTDKIASRSIFLTPLHIILPWLLGKQTAGPKPLNVFLWVYPYRILMGIAFAGLVYWTPSFKLSNGEFPYIYYAIFILAYYLQQIFSYCIFVSMMAFFAQISDPKIGGTYMTLLNTLANLGRDWPATLVLSVTDLFNKKNCISITTKEIVGVCTAKLDEKLCKEGGDQCEWVIDGYYISAALCTVLGLIWYKFFYSRIQHFQRIPRSEWRVIKKH